MTWGPSERFAVVVAAALAIIVTLAARRRGGPWIIASAAFVPVVITAFFSRQFDFVGWHGFMHASPLYQIMERGVLPPENPLYAGTVLRYPWIEHWLMAMIVKPTGLNAHVVFLSVEALALLAFLGGVAWLARAFTQDRVTIALAVVLGAFGISIFHVGLFAEPLQQALPGLWLETRVVPLDKFLNISSMPIAYAASVIAAAGGVHVAKGAARTALLVAIVAACTFVAALVHALSWLGILVWTGVICAVLLAERRSEERRRAIWLALAVGIPSIVCLPYVSALGASQSTDGWSGVTNSLGLLGAKAADLAFFVAVPVALAMLHRRDLAERLRARDRATWILMLTIASMMAAYLVTRLPGRNEYKFMLHLAPAAAILMALALRERLRTHPVPVLFLLFLLFVPGAHALGYRPWFVVTDPVRTDGPFLRALDLRVDSLYQWIARGTPPDAVFIASDLRVPPLGHRSLYVPMDAPWMGRDGWGMPRFTLLQWLVKRPDAEMARRQHLAAVVVNDEWALDPARTMTAVRGDVPGRPLYVQATSAGAIAKLDRTPGFTRRFAGGAGVVYEYTRFDVPGTQ